jgi:predicted ester cyclase
MAESNEAVLRAAVASFNDPDRREDYLELYGEDVVLHGYPDGLTGKAGAYTFYSRLWSAFPDARLTVEQVIEQEDQLAVRYALSGEHASEFFGTPSSGGRAQFEGIAWLRFAGGHAVEVWQASGTLATLTRLTARAAQSRTRRSASADAAALRWQEGHPDE